VLRIFRSVLIIPPRRIIFGCFGAFTLRLALICQHNLRVFRSIVASIMVMMFFAAFGNGCEGEKPWIVNPTQRAPFEVSHPIPAVLGLPSFVTPFHSLTRLDVIIQIDHGPIVNAGSSMLLHGVKGPLVPTDGLEPGMHFGELVCGHPMVFATGRIHGP
jgi:hypothetical protein